MNGTYLDGILAAKRADLAKHASPWSGNLSDRSLSELLAELGPTRDFEAALRGSPRPRVIAEFKRRSPSEGNIRADADPGEIGRMYQAAGAAALSVLTDRHFAGTMQDLERARSFVDLPILCKDFILERAQLVEARQAGADAALVIVAALDPPRLRQLLEFSSALGLHVLCEAHDEYEVDRALAAGARIVGVNARDLRTFKVDLDVPIRCRKLVPKSFTYVAESGIHTREHVDRIRQADVDAVLIGTHPMRSEHPGETLRMLMSQS